MEKAMCPFCGEVQEDDDYSIDWTCPNGCHLEEERDNEYWLEKSGDVFIHDDE